MKRSVLLLTVIVSNGTAFADDAGSKHLTGDWGGFRTDLEQSGVDLELNYTSEIAYNAAGGSKHAVRYTDQWAFSSSFDLERLLDIHDAEVKLTITDRRSLKKSCRSLRIIASKGIRGISPAGSFPSA